MSNFGKRKTKIVFSLVFITAAVVIGLIFWGKSRVSQDPGKRYNVVIIVSDALRCDVLGCYGGEAYTPNIDRLARRGVLFRNAYSNSPWTTPSSVSMFSGSYASTYANGARKIILKDISFLQPAYFVKEDELLLPEVLKKLEYDVRLQLNNPNAIISNNMQGLQTVSKKMKGFRQPGKYEILSDKRRKEIEEQTGISAYSPIYKRLYPLLDYLLKIRDEEIFTLIWFNDPHSPYDPIEKFKNRISINTEKLPHPPEYYQEIKNFRTWEKRKTLPIERNYIRNLYEAEVESIDERVGYIIKALKKRRLLHKTYIIFTSDHGESFGGHGLNSHGSSFYQEQVHIPLIFFGPGLSRNLIVKTPVSILALMPTIEDLLGLSTPLELQGTSIKPLLTGKNMQPEVIYFDSIQKYSLAFKMQKRKHVDALLKDNFKLITLENNLFELYNLSKDPGETRNLARRKPGLVKELYRIIKQIREDNKNLRQEHLEGVPKDRIIIDKRQDVIKKLRALGYIN